MTDRSPPVPPRWPRAALYIVLPSDPMRDAIVGDLHEEFLKDTAQAGLQSARARYAGRAAGIVMHAAVDFLRLRSWVSTSPAPAPARAAAAVPTVALLAHARGITADALFVVLALAVLVAGIAINTIMFSAVRGNLPATAAQGPVPPALAVGGVVLLLACAGLAAVVLCAGPRWRRRRRQN